MADVIEILLSKWVKVDHPITCSNPSEYFEIKQVKCEGNPMNIKIYVRGEDTMWFNTNLILDWSDEEPIHLNDKFPWE